MSTLGARTVLLRKSLGLTQLEFGKVGGLSQANLSLLENDGVYTNVKFFINIKDAYPNINLNWWICGEGTIFNSNEKDLDIEGKLDPDIKKFLSEIRNEISNISLSNKLISRKKKD